MAAQEELKVKEIRRDIFSVDPDSLVIIGIDEGDESHPLYDPRVKLDVDETLVRSILLSGVIVPVIARSEGGKRIVIDGRQRVRAAREANKRLRAAGEPLFAVPTALRRTSEEDAATVVVVTNEIRRNDPPSVKALKAAKLRELYGKSNAELADIFGVSPATIGNWVRLADAPKDVVEMVDAGKLTIVEAIQAVKGGSSRAEIVRAAEKTASEKVDGRTLKVKDTSRSAPSKSELRSMLATLRNEDSAFGEQAVSAKKLLAWVLGEGECPIKTDVR